MVIPLPVNRNTLNQRASRERRRTYIQDLERRVCAYKTQGVQVTAEIQTAARKVAEENGVLKNEVEILRERCRFLEQKILTFADDDLVAERLCLVGMGGGGLDERTEGGEGRHTMRSLQHLNSVLSFLHRRWQQMLTHISTELTSTRALQC